MDQVLAKCNNSWFLKVWKRKCVTCTLSISPRTMLRASCTEGIRRWCRMIFVAHASHRDFALNPQSPWDERGLRHRNIEMGIMSKMPLSVDLACRCLKNTFVVLVQRQHANSSAHSHQNGVGLYNCGTRSNTSFE